MTKRHLGFALTALIATCSAAALGPAVLAQGIDWSPSAEERDYINNLPVGAASQWALAAQEQASRMWDAQFRAEGEDLTPNQSFLAQRLKALGFFNEDRFDDEREYRCGSDIGASYSVPFGTHSGRALLSGVERRALTLHPSDNQYHDFMTFTGVEMGPEFLAEDAAGWSFEQSGFLIKTYDGVGYNFIGNDPDPNFEVIDCVGVIRYLYLTNKGTTHFQKRGKETTCKQRVLASKGAGLQRCQMLTVPAGCVETQFWSTDGQMSLDASNPSAPVIRHPDGTTETFAVPPSQPGPDGRRWGPELPFIAQHEMIFSFTAMGHSAHAGYWVTSQTRDTSGNLASYEYNPSGWLTRITDSRGRKTVLQRDARARVQSITKDGPGGTPQTWTMTWTLHNGLATRAIPEIVCESYSLGHAPTPQPCDTVFTSLTAMQLPDGRQFQFTYGEWGDLKTATTPDGARTVFEYGTAGTPFDFPPGFDDRLCPNNIWNLFPRRLVSTRTHASSTAPAEQSISLEHVGTEHAASSETLGSCRRIQWSIRRFTNDPTGMYKKTGVCWNSGPGVDELVSKFNGYTVAEETWDATGLREATYFGHVPSLADPTTTVGKLFVEFETASEPPAGTPWRPGLPWLNGGQLLDVRQTRVVHFRDGIYTTEIRGYDTPSVADPTAIIASAGKVRTWGNVARSCLAAGIASSCTPGSAGALKELTTVFKHSSAYTKQNLLRLIQTTLVRDGITNTLLEHTSVTYDEFGLKPTEAPNVDRTTGCGFRNEGQPSQQICNSAGMAQCTLGGETVPDGCVRGLATRKTGFAIPTTPAAPSTVVSTYHDTGAIRTVFDPRGAPTTTTFDSFAACGSARTRVKTTVENILGHRTTTVTDCFTDAVLSVTTPNSVRTCTQFDAFGREVAVTGPGDSISAAPGLTTDPDCTGGAGGPGTTIDHPPLGQQLRWTIHRTKDGTSDGHQKKTFLDGLGRTVQSCIEVDPAIHGHGWSCDGTAYDTMGRISKQFVAFYADGVGATPVAVPSGTQFHQTTYDALGRVTVSELVGPTAQIFQRTQTSYGTASYTVLDGGAATGFLTTVKDANNHETRTVTNPLGHVVEVRREWSGCPEGFCTTRMKPDALGRVTQIRDPAGNDTMIELDGLGRRTKLIDPDMGTWSYAYDANDNVIRQTDGKGQITTMQYDQLDRLTLENRPPLTPGVEDIVNTYDGVVPSSCYSCDDHCPTTTDSCVVGTGTCTHIGAPCDPPAVICTGCQVLNAAGTACVPLDAGAEGDCPACQDCDGAGTCRPLDAGSQDVGCSGGQTACSNPDTCNGAGACQLNHLGPNTEGGCPACQDCDGGGECRAVTTGHNDAGCDGGQTACSNPDVCINGACERNHLGPNTEGACPTCQDCDGNGECKNVDLNVSDNGCNAGATSCSAADVCNGSGTCNIGDVDRLHGGMQLLANQFIQSCDRRFTLVMQGDGNLVVYGPGSMGAIWAAGTNGPDRRAVMQTDGNFVVYTPPSTALWHTNTWGHPGSILVQQNDGNLVVWGPGGNPLWQTGIVKFCGDNFCDPTAESSTSCPQDCCPDFSVPFSCWPDGDGDGFGTGGAVRSCNSCSPGHVRNNSDCFDTNAQVRPGQTQCFFGQRGDGSFDYNCNGTTDICSSPGGTYVSSCGGRMCTVTSCSPTRSPVVASQCGTNVGTSCRAPHCTDDSCRIMDFQKVGCN